jgi:hypothetical protein
MEVYPGASQERVASAESMDLAGQSVSHKNCDILASGGQPTHDRFPQLIEDGLTPDVHLRRALTLEHPYIAASGSTDAVKRALSNGFENAEALNTFRKNQTKTFMELSIMTEPEDAWIRQLVHPSVAKVLEAYGPKNLALMREIDHLCNPDDFQATMWLALGLPMLGWAPPAAGLLSRLRPPEASIESWLEDRCARNSSILQGIRPSGDNVLDQISLD